MSKPDLLNHKKRESLKPSLFNSINLIITKSEVLFSVSLCLFGGGSGILYASTLQTTSFIIVEILWGASILFIMTFQIKNNSSYAKFSPFLLGIGAGILYSMASQLSLVLIFILISVWVISLVLMFLAVTSYFED